MLAPGGCCSPGGGGCFSCGASGSCVGDCCACAETTNSAARETLAKIVVPATKRRSALVARRGVSSFCVKGERGESPGGPGFDFDLSPPGVMCFVARPVSQNILIPQLHANLGGDVRKIFHSLYGKDAATSHICHVIQKRGAVQFFRRPATITKRVKDAYCIELGVRLFHQPLDIAL